MTGASTRVVPIGLPYRRNPAALEAKLRPPLANASQVPRRGILDLFDSSPAARLVLIRAPAGFGKTTVMLQFRSRLQESGIRSAWLTLDRSDNDVSRFLEGLMAALAGVAEDALPDAARDGALPGLIAALAMSAQPFALFIDEFEVIREPGVLGLLRELIASLPVCGQVVIATRSAPDLSLGRLRARGQLLEIDAGMLRFSEAESSEFLSSGRGATLAEGERRLLHQKTEGWVAGLWLAAVALARHASPSDFIARFTGSSSTVAEYLAEDVLDLQPPEVQSFLLRTSILRELDPLLCQQLCPDTDCDALLRRLEADNILVMPIEGEHRSYRYHGLFAGFLQAQLIRTAGSEVPGLHVAAARWFETQGRPVPAIEHALAGGDHALALQLLEAHAMDLLAAGRLRLLSRWLGEIPPDSMAAHPRLRVVHLWALGFTRGPWEALAELDRTELDDCRNPEVQAHLMAMRPVFLATMDREEGYELGMDCLARLPTGNAFADGALLSTLAAVSVDRRRPDEALRLLDFRRRLLGDFSSDMGDMHVESVLGTVAMIEGRLSEARTHFRTAVTTTPSSTHAFTKGNAWAGILYAMVVYESGSFEDVRSLLQVYVPIARDAGIPDHLTLGYRMLCRLAFERGDIDRAFNALAELESFGYQRHYARVLASARLERSRLQLIQGHVHAARDELERGSDPETWAAVAHRNPIASDIEYPELCRLRWQACAGNPGVAAEGLDRELSRALAARRTHRALKLRVLRAGALHRAGEERRAIRQFLEIAHDCSREGFLRIAADEAQLIGPLARIAERAGGEPAPDARESEWIHRLRTTIGDADQDELLDRAPFRQDSDAPHRELHQDAQIEGGMPPQNYRLDPLTPREQRVLRLLAEGYSNAAMSEKLYVSDSTVRTHLRNINSKLGVRSRTQAVLAAQRLGLLR